MQDADARIFFRWDWGSDDVDGVISSWVLLSEHDSSSMDIDWDYDRLEVLFLEHGSSSTDTGCGMDWGTVFSEHDSCSTDTDRGWWASLVLGYKGSVLGGHGGAGSASWCGDTLGMWGGHGDAMSASWCGGTLEVWGTLRIRGMIGVR